MTCPDCNGTGMVVWYGNTDSGEYPCKRCGCTGEIGDKNEA